MFSLNLWARPYLPPHLGGIPPGSGDPSNFLQNPLTPPGVMVLTSSPETTRGSKDPYSVPPVMSTAGPFGHPLYPPGFLRAGVDPRAFGLAAGADKMGFGASHHSAFTPAKRPRLDTDSPDDHQKQALDCTKGSKNHSPNHSPLYRPYANHDDSFNSRSPASTGRVSPNDSREEETPRDFPESKRYAKLTEELLPGTCPVCGQKLDKGSYQEHLSMELHKLEASIRNGTCIADKENVDIEVPLSAANENNSPKFCSSSRYQTYLRIKGNRQSRFNVKYGKMTRRKFEMSQTATSSPIEMMTAAQLSPDPCHGTIRLPGNQMQRNITMETSDAEEEDVDVGWDEPPCLTPNTSATSNATTDDDENHSHNKLSPLSSRSENDTSNVQESGHSSKSKTCTLCKMPCKNGVASLLCWHVFCHSCWTHSLEKEKSCPQCKTATTSTDLRRVFV